MFSQKKESYSILRVEKKGRDLISVEELSYRCELHPKLIEHYIDLGIISPVEYGKTGYLFDERVVDKIRSIKRLRMDLGVNLVSAGIILDLLEEVDELKKELARFRIMR